VLDHPLFREKYSMSTLMALKVVFGRELLLWWRDKYARKARLIQCVFMGLVVGTVFWQTDDPQTVMGVIFQSVFFISMGSMLKVAPQITSRGIFYKEQDANFYPTWIYVLARALAGIPTSLQDSLIYGSLIYWFSGFVPTAQNYFVFLLLVLLCAFACGLMFSIFSATIKDRPTAQACMSITLVVMIVFSGFTVQPDIIPPYYIWIYWMNLFAWISRAVVINEYQSGRYDTIVSEDGTTEGEAIMERFGFTFKGEAYEYVWVWWTVLFCVGLCIVSNASSVWALGHVRFATGGSLGGGEDTGKKPAKSSETADTNDVSLETKGATLTFKDVNYVVKASTTKDKLHLLKGINGYFAAGKMTALMGSSGAGKTTLMDVLSLRKASGEVTGDIRVNGHPQESRSFRRMTGYVEQFDEQSPQLTIRETVEFSAKMRLEESIPKETKLKFVEHVLEMLELDEIGDFIVGNDNGGLSFEQRKRLSIAVELASNPSCIFLDEPTSGLDARAASIVMRSLRRIANSGIAVVATIHQPSVAIFNSFDSLLLLKRGGETVFFGELGDESYNLIEYLESYPATSPIKKGENPATWMLTAIGAGSSGTNDFDYAKAYTHSPLSSDCVNKIDSMNGEVTEEGRITFPTKYATSARYQSIQVYKRLSKIYWRSPGYNRVRLLVSGIVALLFGSVFASQRVPQNEGDMNSRVTSIYITMLFLGVNAMNTVLPVFELERNMFYRHKASLAYDHRATTLAFTIVEVPFILLSSMVFCLLWYFTVGFAFDAGKFFLYYLFMTFGLAVFTFLGQGFMAIFRDSQTAQGFGSLLIGMSSIFGGVLIRPQDISTFWIWAYWSFPLHYVLEGLLTSQFEGDNTPIVASLGSPFYEYTLEKNCPNMKPDHSLPAECITGTAEDWIYASFGGMWVPEHIPYCVIYLIGAIVVAKFMAWYGLKEKNFLAK
jgi:ABC-type multidrug transport system ATPase subunit/ABC-type multidrug transport system permease subunit